MSIYKHFTHLCSRISGLNNVLLLNAKAAVQARIFKCAEASSSLIKEFHTSSRSHGLMEFFDDPKNWDKEKIQVGRAWKLDELRIKSNSDLHKLWFVLLKEKNMLLTTAHEYAERFIHMPNPERLHKVNESMENLETVVRERNKAYYLLETGETGEQEVVEDHNSFGLKYKRKLTEHYVDRKYDLVYKKRSIARHRMVFDKDVIWFLKRFKEKLGKRELFYHKARYDHVCGLLRRFKGIDEEAIKEEYPDVDLEKAKKDPKSRGPRLNMY